MAIDPYAMLRQIVAKRKLSKKDLAHMTDRDCSSVWHWLAPKGRGRCRPDEISRRVLEAKLGVPSDAWLSKDERQALERAGAKIFTKVESEG